MNSNWINALRNPITVDKNDLRKFGYIFSCMLLLIFELMIPLWLERPWPLWPLYIAAPVAMLALLWPAGLHPLYLGWMKFGAVMAFVNTRIIMSLLFFFILTPIGLLLRTLGKKPLICIFDRSLQSYRSTSAIHNKEDLEKPY